MSERASGASVWQRPADMAKRDFDRFVGEVEDAVGRDRRDLIAAVAGALSASEADAAVLALDAAAAAAQAREWSARCGGDAAAYLRHLAYRHELAWRARHGPAIWERKVDVVPCPDFLPCGPCQVRQSRIGLYRLAHRLANVAFITAFVGAFPLLVLPSAARLFSWRIISASWTRTSIAIWCAAAAVAAVGFGVLRLLRGRRIRG